MAAIKVVLKRTLSNGRRRIAIRVSDNYHTNYINLNIETNPEDWNVKEGRFKRAVPGAVELNDLIDEKENLVRRIIQTLTLSNNYSFALLKERFLEAERKPDTVQKAFEKKLTNLKRSKKYGTYKSYQCGFNALKKYANLDIPFDAIDYKFLQGFVQMNEEIGNKPNTTNNYLRSLRALHYEYCKIYDLQEPAIYKKFKLSKVKNETVKRALSLAEIRKFIKYKPKNKAGVRAKYLFLFSFYSRGINFVDMLQLKKENLKDGGVLSYIRQKTKKKIHLRLNKRAFEIIDYFQNDSPYLFPYIRKGDNIKYRSWEVNKRVNKQLKKIGEEIGVSDLTMYAARHTWATLALHSGIRAEQISQMLGHSELTTTQIYLRGFGDEELDNLTDKVFDSI